MALVLKDRVKETSTTAGTGTLTLAGATAGYQSFAAVGNGNTTYYAIVDPIANDWEVGIGTYTSSGTTLSRTTVLSSSAGGGLVTFAANSKDVFCTYPSEKAVYLDAADVVAQLSFGAITATSAALTTGTVSTLPSSNTDIANKQYVDTVSASGIHYHDPVYVEVPNTFGNLNATYNNGASGVGATLTNAGTQAAFTADGISVPLNSRVLVYNQTNAAQNGVYTLTTVGSGSTNWVLTRATDANTYSPYSPNGLGQGDAFFVTNGLTGAGETYICNTVGTITFGTTAITFAQISDSTLYTAGTGLTLTGTEFSITNTGVTAATYGSASTVPVIAVNAQGQATSVTNTNIAINGSAVSGNIAGSAGSVANALTLGTYLTGTSYNGSAAVTAAVDATSANTASKVVARDASGNFSAGTITATLSGAATSATTATNIAGGAANQVPYQTGAATTSFITAPTVASTYLNWTGSAFAWSAISTPNSVTFNNGGAGDVSGTTFNGSAARTISYNTVGASPLAGSTSLTTTGTVTTGTWSGLFGAVSGANLTSLTAGNLSGTIPSGVLGNSTAYVGTTAVALNRGSANQALTGILSVTMPGSTSGSTTLQPSAVAGATTITMPATTGTMALTSDLPTVNNGTLTMAVSGTGLSGSATFTANQAGASTFTVTSNATNANTASTIVARDASGNFSAGTITAALSGNATTATTAGSITSQANSATITATSANTANQIVLRDASGNFSAGTITASLSGNATTSSSTSGNAGTATTLIGDQTNWASYRSSAVANMLSWKNYGNGHVIFDASAGTSPTGSAVNNTNAAVAWAGTYPTLMGWNGSSTYGVRVDSARVADSAPANGGNSSTVGGFTPSATAGTASRVVVADGSGYINNTYFNSTDNSVTSGVSGVMVKAGDNYLRTGSAAAVATFISGQTMNIAGSATTFTSTSQNSQFNSVGVGTAASGTAGEIRATNNVTAYYSSDIKFKENVRDIPNAAATAAAIGGKLFDWKAEYIEEHGGEDGYFIVKADFGVIAQDVQAKFPVAVRTRPDGSLAVDYEKLSALALAANAEHEERIAKLEALVAKLIEG